MKTLFTNCLLLAVLSAAAYPQALLWQKSYSPNPTVLPEGGGCVFINAGDSLYKFDYAGNLLWGKATSFGNVIRLGTMGVYKISPTMIECYSFLAGTRYWAYPLPTGATVCDKACFTDADKNLILAYAMPATGTSAQTMLLKLDPGGAKIWETALPLAGSARSPVWASYLGFAFDDMGRTWAMSEVNGAWGITDTISHTISRTVNEYSNYYLVVVSKAGRVITHKEIGSMHTKCTGSFAPYKADTSYRLDSLPYHTAWSASMNRIGFYHGMLAIGGSVVHIDSTKKVVVDRHTGKVTTTVKKNSSSRWYIRCLNMNGTLKTLCAIPTSKKWQDTASHEKGDFLLNDMSGMEIAGNRVYWCGKVFNVPDGSHDRPFATTLTMSRGIHFGIRSWKSSVIIDPVKVDDAASRLYAFGANDLRKYNSETGALVDSILVPPPGAPEGYYGANTYAFDDGSYYRASPTGVSKYNVAAIFSSQAQSQPSVMREIDQPHQFVLEQNYPNPFNPTTDIGFRIADVGLVRLTIFNVLGEEIATLVDEVKPSGDYHVQWNAAGISSGVYFYRLTVTGANGDNAFSLVRKLLLLR